MSVMSFCVSDIHVYIIITYVYIYIYLCNMREGSGGGWVLKKHWYIYMYTCIRWFLKKLRTKNDAVYISLHLFEVSISEECTYVLQDNHKQRDGFNTQPIYLGPLLSQSDQQCKALTVGSLCHLERCESKRGRNTLRHTAKWGFDHVVKKAGIYHDLSPTQTGIFNQ